MKIINYSILIFLFIHVSLANASNGNGSIHNLNKCLVKNGFNYKFINDKTKQIIKDKCVDKNQVKINRKNLKFQADPLRAQIQSSNHGFHLTISSYYNPDPNVIITAIKAIVTYRNKDGVEFNNTMQSEKLWIQPFEKEEKIYMGWFENVRKHFSEKTEPDYCQTNLDTHCKTWKLSELWGINIIID